MLKPMAVLKMRVTWYGLFDLVEMKFVCIIFLITEDGGFAWVVESDDDDFDFGLAY
mgnify:CR=1 FL=1